MPPSMFDQMMNSFAGPVASSGAIPQPFGTVGGSGLGSLVGGGMAMPAGDGSMSTFTEHEGYMNNWPNPNAPLEWEDWGSYMTNLTGMKYTNEHER
ncbi:hypothetical protein QCA50_014345 [Cerrena zonata]|uniref:Uncharacterized protein n=1 Tax=Cerrena zonata TaxID=2478898 RepID=A0AAW0FMH5_9APHY